MKRERKLNLLFVLIQVNTGGTERIVLELAKNLDSSNFNKYLVFFENGSLEKDFEKVCQGIFKIEKKEGIDFAAMWHISRIIQQKHIDVINAHHYMPFFYSYLGSKILQKRKLIYTEHSIPEINAIISSKHKKLFNLMIRNTDKVVGVSKEIGQTFKDSFPKHSEKIVTIVNGVNIEKFGNPINRDIIRSKWGILPEEFVIGTVANFRKIKNHICLVRAFNILKSSYPQIRLLLVGQGYKGDEENSEEEIRNMINIFKLQKEVIMTGYQGDIPNILKIIDIFCLPSFSEGLPVSVLEAMASGIPVVGSNVRGIREVILSEETGLLFTSDDDKALARALRRLIEDKYLKESISRKALNFVRQNHNLEQWVSTYKDLFNCKEKNWIN